MKFGVFLKESGFEVPNVSYRQPLCERQSAKTVKRKMN